MKDNFLFILFISAICHLPSYVSSQVLGTYNCTGGVQNYVVPSGICQVRIKAWGAGGGGGGVDAYGGGAGGGGAYADRIINVIAGDVLAVYVGCTGIPGTGCATNAGGGGGWGYGIGGIGGNAGPVPCSGSGGGGGGSSGVLQNGTLVISAAGGAGGGGGGCLSAGGDGGAGGVNGNGTTCTGGGGTALNGTFNGGAGQSHPADGGGGGGGGGGAVNGGQGGFAPPSGPSCNAANDCGAGGGGGGDSYAPAGTITNGSGTIPGNNADPDLCVGCAQGGGSQAIGTNGFVEIIAVFPQVIATASSNSPICLGATLNLTSSGGASYSWIGPNSFTSISQNPSIVSATPAASGTYSVIVTDANGCSAVATVNVVVNPLPVVNAGNDLIICNGDVALLNASGGIIYSWIPSTFLSNSNISNPTANPNITISYTVVVVDANTCINADSMTITVNPLPIPNAGLDASICSGFSTTLNASGGGSYLWTPAAGLSSTVISNPVATPILTTTYVITVTDANNCSATDNVIVTVNPRPIASFTATTVCFNSTATVFTDQSSGGNITQWDWSFGDGNIDSVQNPTHTYSGAGSYVAILVVTTAEGCKDTFGLTVVVHPLPASSFSSTTVCLGTPTCFADASTISSGSINSWSWNFGDPPSGANNISNVQNPCHTFTNDSTFSVVLTVTSGFGCQSTTIISAVVITPPVAIFTATTVCLNNPTLFTDASTGTTSWSWFFGDGGTSAQQNPSHIYLAYGNYLATLIVSAGGTCNDTVSVNVIVNPLPIVNFFSDTVCQGFPTSFTDVSFIPSGNISSWLWNFGDGDTSSLQNPTHVYSASGSFNATLSVTSNNGCMTTLVLPVLVYPLPSADFSSAPSPAELIDVVDFTDISTGIVTQWLWDFGDGTNDSIQNPSHTYSDTGFYLVTHIVITWNGCVDTIQKIVTISDYTFYVPNTFTPNGDGINDFFFAEGIGIIDYELFIFDRWGNLVFYCTNAGLPQEQPCMWDGKIKGGDSNELVQDDVYVWKIRLTNIYKKESTFIGNVNMVK